MPSTLPEYLAHAPQAFAALESLQYDDLSFEAAKAAALIVWAAIDERAGRDDFDPDAHDEACGDLSIILERHVILRAAGTLSDGTPWELWEGVWDAEVSRWDLVMPDDVTKGGSTYYEGEAWAMLRAARGEIN